MAEAKVGAFYERADIIEALLRRGLITNEGTTEKGRIVQDAIRDIAPGLSDPENAEQWESLFAEVEKGETPPIDAISRMKEALREIAPHLMGAD